MLSKRPLERTNCGWRIELKRILKIIYEGVDWIHLAQEGVQLWCVPNIPFVDKPAVSWMAKRQTACHWCLSCLESVEEVTDTCDNVI
jgi:predicted RecB family nuclease